MAINCFHADLDAQEEEIADFCQVESVRFVSATGHGIVAGVVAKALSR